MESHGTVCVWCANRDHEVCEPCGQEGLRYLVPEPLPTWEAAPTLPPMRDLVGMAPWQRLAWLYLALAYHDRCAP